MEIKNIKEIRSLNLSAAKTTSGYHSFRVMLPKKWIDEMGLGIDNKALKVSFDGEKIIIEKANND